MLKVKQKLRGLNVRQKIIFIGMVLTLILIPITLMSQDAKAIDNGRTDLGILDSLTIKNQYGYTIAPGDPIYNGDTYNLRYEFSLDEPTGDYKNKVATFNIPDVFKPNSINPQVMDLIFDDGAGGSFVIGTVTADTNTGKLTVNFNDSNVLGTKSNIKGWISLSVVAESTQGTHTFPINWEGGQETTINVIVANHGPGNKTAQVNKFLSSPKAASGQPQVQKNANGEFYISFNIEVFISQSYTDLVLTDQIYAGMKIDVNSLQVVSRPKDYQEYLAYKTNYDAWVSANPSGPLKSELDITAELDNNSQITKSADGFYISFNNVDFNPQLASRQLATKPLQQRYVVKYNTILTNIDPALSLADAQLVFERQEVKNKAILAGEGKELVNVSWVKPILGGGATGETRSITIQKVDGNTLTNLDGAVFNLYKKSIYTNEYELFADNITVNGTQLVNNLTFGEYRLVETVAPTDYIIDPDYVVDFTIDANIPTGTPLLVQFKNYKPEVGALEVLKLGPNQEKLAGAQFEVKNSAGTVVETITSGADGLAKTTIKLVPGVYTLVEKVAPTGYVLDSTPRSFTVVAGATAAVHLDFANVKDIGALEVLKLGPNQEKLAGAQFEVKNSAGTVVETITSGLDGLAKTTIDLAPGAYTLVEKVAPAGYVLDQTPRTVTIVEGATAVVHLDFTNVKDIGALEVLKLGPNQEKLAGAQFEVKNSAGTVVETITSGTDGLAKTTIDLIPGVYTLVEKVAPAGYILDPTPRTVTILEGASAVVHLDFANAKDVGALEVLKLGPNQEKLAGAQFEVKNSVGTVVETITSGTDGLAKTTIDLAPGVYTLVEKVAPIGYVLDPTPRTVTIVEGASAVVHLDFTNAKDVGALEVLKLGPNQEDLAGAQFEVKNSAGTVVETITSGADGLAKTTIDLAPGVYTLVEKVAPAGYVLDPTPRTVTIVEGATAVVHLDFANAKDVGALEVLKLGPNQEKLAGAQFEVKNSAGTVVETITSGADGLAKTTIDLVPGVYTLVEKVAPAGYILDPTPRTVTIVEGASAVVHLDFANAKDVGALEVLKLSENLEKELVGAQFEVRDSAGTVIETITSGADGLAKTTIDLEPGVYTLVETVAPTGYILDPTPRTVTIVEGASTVVHLDFANAKDVGALEVLKLGPNQEELAGAQFEVRDSAGTVVETITSGLDGLAKTSIDLEPGVYTLVEIDAPEGYLLDPTEHTVTIVEGASVAVHLDFLNTKDVGALEVLKIGLNKEKLIGAKFEVIDSEGKIVETITSGPDGIAKTSIDLVPGEYTLVEVKAPIGYVLDPTVRKISIKEGFTAPVHLDFVNVKNPEQVKIPKTGDTTGLVSLVFIALGSLLTAKVLINKRKIRCK